MHRILRRALACALVLGSPAAAARHEEPARFDWFEYRGDDKLPRPKAGEYANPLLQGFYPDPSIVRVGSDYYLVNSTFAWFPGMPLFHSRDLVHWTQIGNAIARPGELKLEKLGMSQGLYAPDISWDGKSFYIVNTCVGCGGTFVITARRPQGPWSDPIWLPRVSGIDPSLFFDDDGSAWLVHNGPPQGTPRYPGHTAIWLEQFDPKALKTVGEPRVLVDAGVHPEDKPVWIEGPHIFKKDGNYYLVAAEGGTEENHSEVVFRSARVTGPYVPLAANPILTQRDLASDRPQPITSTGHAKLVDTPTGDWWALFLGVRPYDSAGDFNTGRETFLMPVRWRDGWPRITERGQRVPWTAPLPRLPLGTSPLPTNGTFTLRQDFSAKGLAPYWLMLREPHRHWWRIRRGALELDPGKVGLSDPGNPSLLARRQQHLNCSATTKVRFAPARPGSEAGLVAFQNGEHWYFLGIGSAGGKSVVRLRRRSSETDPGEGIVLAQAAVGARKGSAVELRIEAHGPSYDFSWSTNGQTWRTLVKGADGTILSTKKAGGFVGAVFGLYAHDSSGGDT